MKAGETTETRGLQRWHSMPASRTDGNQFLLNDCGHLGDIELYPSSWVPAPPPLRSPWVAQSECSPLPPAVSLGTS